jgi:hypothetical protein
MSSSPLMQFMKIPSSLIETGLVTMGSALSAMLPLRGNNEHPQIRVL